MLEQLSTKQFEQPTASFSPGPVPQLEWIEIKRLAVNRSYQREIGKRGAFNIRQIAENFDWSKFAPVIVAPEEGGIYAIVDGQHRTTAAALRGLKQVPCQIVQADRAQQAAAFAAVNGNVTKTLPQQIFHARLAACEPLAMRVRDVCASAGVIVLRRNLSFAKAQVGQTNAVACLTKCLEVYGEHTLRVGLRCITQTGGGNAGFVRACIIEAICEVLNEHKHWRDNEEALLKVLDKFSIPDLWSELTEGKDRVYPSAARTAFAENLKKFLGRRMPAMLERKAA